MVSLMSACSHERSLEPFAGWHDISDLPNLKFNHAVTGWLFLSQHARRGSKAAPESSDGAPRRHRAIATRVRPGPCRSNRSADYGVP